MHHDPERGIRFTFINLALRSGEESTLPSILGMLDAEWKEEDCFLNQPCMSRGRGTLALENRDGSGGCVAMIRLPVGRG